MPHFLMSDHWTLLKDYLKNQRKFRHTKKMVKRYHLLLTLPQKIVQPPKYGGKNLVPLHTKTKLMLLITLSC